MAKAFTRARAMTKDGAKVEGVYDPISKSIVCDGGKKYAVDSDTLKFNTGFVDAAGKEVFDGDALFGKVKVIDTWKIRYIDEYGAFMLGTCRYIDSKGLSKFRIIEDEEGKGNGKGI